ncbi:hypothetical protein ACA910_003843 [Epithemia clementina (nom. ined.)]
MGGYPNRQFLLSSSSSSSSSMSTTSTTSTSAAAATPNPFAPFAARALPPKPQPPRVVSRRAWQEYKEKHKSMYDGPPPQDKAKQAADEKPWPKSVVYTAYVLGATLIPYFGTWLAVTNETTRSFLFSSSWVGPDLQQALRHHFGTTEWHAVPYPEQVGAKVATLPHFFVGELPWPLRQQQERIAKEQAQNRKAPIRIRIFQQQQQQDDGVASTTTTTTSNYVSSSENMVDLDETISLSINTLATPQAILPHLSIKQLPANSSMALDFPSPQDSEEEDSSGTGLEEAETNSTFVTDPDSSSHQNETNFKTLDPLLGRVNPYSVWYFHPIANPSTQQQVSFHVSENEIRAAELQVEISQLEAELRDGASHRSVDQIVEELNDRKRQLRRIQWRKWLPW